MCNQLELHLGEIDLLVIFPSPLFRNKVALKPQTSLSAPYSDDRGAILYYYILHFG